MPNAKHPKTCRFVDQKLFSSLSSFVELEQRISDLPDEKSRGDAFEVFAEAYLAIMHKHDAEAVWPLNTVPGLILGSLKLSAQDYGVDGVLKTRLGKFSAYQVKFRSSRPALTWRELSTFMGLADSPNIHSRILITNCDDLPPVLNDRQGFFCIRGSDLDRLEAEDFNTIEAWLADATYRPQKKSSLPHQIEALNAIVPAFSDHDRLSAIMSCGTGKTLVALWTLEKILPSRVLVLVPSLALLRQILHEWLRETSLPSLAYLCVCSDPTVKEGVDRMHTQQSDLDFEVSTAGSSVREFLDASFAGTKIIFSTYQSASVVGQALHPGEAFDFGVFDEAHKTAGREGRNYAYALEDSNLPIRKRLFLTATPRHYNPRQQNTDDESQLVFSMDRPEIYGPQIFRLTFAEAARRDPPIICGYKVIISVITSEMVTNELLKRGEVLVNGETVQARQVANQIALREAVEKYGVNKVFTFHNTVDSAKSFVSEGSEGVRAHLPEFATLHVNGAMPTTQREHHMRDFRTATRAIMSNARCLTEGVDVPAVDMVAFLSPRRSRVDIVQATGRTMRLSPGKTTGYVLVPLYVELVVGESIEAAVSRADFDEVWDVLQSLQEQDDVLAEWFRQSAITKGEIGCFGEGFECDRIDFDGVTLNHDAICAAVKVQCLNRLCTTWDEMVGALKAFKQQHGHCDVPAHWKSHNCLGLGMWVWKQRLLYRNNQLPAAKEMILNGLGFEWESVRFRESAWKVRYDELAQYKSRFGDCYVPQQWQENPALGSWVHNQRILKKDGKLPVEREVLLNLLGFNWETKGASTWQQRFDELARYQEEHGDCNVPTDWAENTALSNWVRTQRMSKKEGRLSPDKEAALNALGFIWEPTREADWQKQFDELRKYRTIHGNCDVPANWEQNPQLVWWVFKQRALQKAGKLSEDKVKMLAALGFGWDTARNSVWKKQFENLSDYKAIHGNCDVPQDDPNLGRWLHKQRQMQKRGALEPERITLLTELGVDWNPSESAWNTRYNELVQYKSKFGDCNVPRRWKDNPELGRWIDRQHTMRKAGKLTPERESILTNLGVLWRQ